MEEPAEPVEEMALEHRVETPESTTSISNLDTPVADFTKDCFEVAPDRESLFPVADFTKCCSEVAPYWRSLFQATTRDDVWRTVAEIQAKQASQMEMRNLTRIRPFLEAVEHLEKAAGIFQSTVDIFAFAWGPVKFLLLAANDHVDAFDILLEAYEQIGTYLPLLKGYDSTVWANDECFQTVLVWIYGDILHFHRRVVELFRGPLWHELLPSSWRAFQPRFQNILHLLNLAMSVLGSSFPAGLLEENQTERLQSLQEFEWQEAARRTSTYQRVRFWIGDLDSESDHEITLHLKREYPTSGKWILKDERYQKWKSIQEQGSPILWVNGIIGAGKTVLASTMVQDCLESPSLHTAYFYCRINSDRNKSEAVFRGLLWQLISKDDVLLSYCLEMFASGGKSSTTGSDLFKRLLKIALQRISPVRIFIDGLDECETGERRQILSFFCTLNEHSDRSDPKEPRVVFVSREEYDIQRALASAPSINLNSGGNNNDLRHYVHTWTNKIRERFELDEVTASGIEEKICAQAGGMFLFAKLVTHKLFSCVSLVHLEEGLAIESRPLELEAIYESITSKIQAGRNLSSWFFRRLLCWLVCANRPLKWRELLAAMSINMVTCPIAIDPWTTRGNIRDLCGPLIKDFEGGVGLVHHTARTYLIAKGIVDPPVAECYLATVCLQYLSLDCFQPDLSEDKLRARAAKGDLVLQDYAIASWSLHLTSVLEHMRKGHSPFQEYADGFRLLQPFKAGIIEFYTAFEGELIQDDTNDCPDIIPTDLEEEPYFGILKALMSHVAQHQAKGSTESDRISIKSLGHALTRNRKLLEDMFALFSGSAAPLMAMTNFYGEKIYKCPLLTCRAFYNGFSSSISRDDHICMRHERLLCPVSSCKFWLVGIESPDSLRKHTETHHQQVTVETETPTSEYNTFPSAPDQNGLHQCSECGRSYRSALVLKAHKQAYERRKIQQGQAAVLHLAGQEDTQAALAVRTGRTAPPALTPTPIAASQSPWTETSQPAPPPFLKHLQPLIRGNIFGLPNDYLSVPVPMRASLEPPERQPQSQATDMRNIPESLQSTVLWRGIIYLPDLRLTGNVSQLLSHLEREQSSGHFTLCSFHLTQSGDHTVLLSLEDARLAILNPPLSHALNRFVEMPSVDMYVHIDFDTIHGAISKASCGIDAKLFFTLTVHGPRDFRDVVGACLTASKVMVLEQPDRQRPGAVNDNPRFSALSETYRDEVHRLTEITCRESSLKGNDTKGQTTPPIALDPRVPTDSGYASTTHDKARLEQRTQATEDGANPENFQHIPCPTDDIEARDVDLVDSATNYSDSSSLPAAAREKYHSEIVDALISTVYSEPLDVSVVERICGVLPELLKAFALKLGHKESNQTHRNIMFFVHKHRSDIVDCFKERYSQKAESVPGPSTVDSDKMSLKDIMALWDSHRGDREHDLVAEPSIQDLSEAAIDESEETHSEYEISEREPEGEFDAAELSIYRDVISNSAAYQWLAGHLRRELLLARAATDCMEIIRHDIVASLPRSNKVSRHRSVQAHHMTFRVLWEPMAFVQEQEYTEAPEVVLERAITLTGTTCDAQALTCAQYLRQTWPSTGEHIMRLLKEMIRGQPGERCQRVLPDHTRLSAWLQHTEVIVEVTGPSCSIAEIGEQLAWIGAALRSSPYQSGVAVCTPFVREVCAGDSLNPLSNGLSVDGTVCTIAFHMQSETEAHPPSNCQCWHDLFKNPVIVDGYPTRRRGEHKTGVEMPLNIMAELAGTRQINTFDGRLFIKGYSAMLVPARLAGDLLIWHLLFNKDGGRISYLHDTTSHVKNLMLSVVTSARHVLGWCSEAKYYAGAGDAVYAVGKSRLPRPHRTCALENFSIYSGKLIVDGVVPCIGNKDSPIHIVRNGYVFKLQWISKKFVVLWDEEDKRGWLVNGTSVLLHLLRAHLEYSRSSNIKSALLFKPEDMEEAAQPYSADSAIEVLLNTANMDLRVYKEGDDYIRLKHQVEHYYDILEQLFDHQVLQDGVGSGLRPRKDLEGWDFQDLVTTRDPVHPRVAALGTIGKGWVDFTRAIHTITLFGRGFGDIIRPVAVDSCAHWASLPKDKYYLAAYAPDLQRIMDLYDGDHMSTPMRLTEDILWHNPANDFVCQCAGKAAGDHSDVAQVLLPSTFAMESLLSQSSGGWNGRGAVIFGQNMSFKWFWKDTGDPEEGQPVSPPAESDSQFHDSGVGQSLASSATEPDGLALQHYTVGIVCALHKELLAVRELFDSRHMEPILPREDSNHYVLGRIGQHNVVTACLPSGEYGTNSAADVVAHMKRSFPNVKFYLLVGIGGGVPSTQNDIRLGDIVVSHPTKACAGVIQYDLGADLEQGGFERTGTLQRPSRFLMTALGILRSEPSTTPTQLAGYIKQIGDRNPTYRHPGKKRDKLIEASYIHDASQRTCEQCFAHEIERKGRRRNHPQIHYGVIASGNRLIRTAQVRDRLGAQDNVLCVEMEAAGVMNTVDCLVIRGICDYADSHKNDTWQEYASAAAAAYAKLFLSIVRPWCESESLTTDSEPLLPRKRRASSTHFPLSKRGTRDSLFAGKS